MTAVILQARLDSSRLPRKAMLPLGGEPLVFRVMEALHTINAEIWILACPEDAKELFAPLAERAGFKLFSGSKEDVLSRYTSAICEFGLQNARIIRATGDNPFVFADAANSINDEARPLGADYAGYAGLPYGAGVESVSAAALLLAAEKAEDPYEREHVCPYLYRNGEYFKLHRPLAPAYWQAPALRLSVDTHADYIAALSLYDELAALPQNERFCGRAIISVALKLINKH
ncbi:MAG: spore coat protein [Spirochaetaceae bacterium]|jgi:spore coat polysaccharide biosynthesis protein SpsF|nr:spore coat protein [Spirochaetaceae bacterium]